MGDRASLLRLLRDLRAEQQPGKAADLERAIVGLFDEVREELYNECDRLEAELEKHRWIPISEKHPPQEYVVTVYDAVTSRVGDGFLDDNDVWLWDEVPATPIKQVTHWQEKPSEPEPPIVGEALVAQP